MLTAPLDTGTMLHHASVCLRTSHSSLVHALALLCSGGLAITTFNVFASSGAGFKKLASVAAPASGEVQLTTIYRDADGLPLRAATTYVFKALALQFGTVCDDLATTTLESDAVQATTALVSIPSPPRTPSLLSVDGCAALIALAPPEDLNGAIPSSFAIQIVAASGATRSVIVDYLTSSTALSSLMPFTNYSVTATLATDMGNTAASPPLWFVTGAATAPAKLPVLEIVNAGSSSLELHWAAPTSTGGGAIRGSSLM